MYAALLLAILVGWRRIIGIDNLFKKEGCDKIILWKTANYCGFPVNKYIYELEDYYGQLC